jgi:general stress protein CsbA
MSAALVLLHTSVIIFIGAFLFAAVEWIEPNRWVAIILKCALLAAGGAAIAARLLP